MTDAPQPRETLDTGFVPGSTWVAAREVAHFAPGATVELDPDVNAFPKPFSQANIFLNSKGRGEIDWRLPVT